MKTPLSLVVWMLSLWLGAGTLMARTAPDGGKNTHRKDSLAPTRKVGIKVNPGHGLVGNLPIYMEYRILPKLSVEASIGLTGKDFLFELGRMIDSPEFQHETRAEAGISASFALRYYLSDRKEAIRGGYFSPVFEYRQYNAVVSTCNDFMDPPAQPLFLEENRNRYYMRFLFGHQSYSKNHFIFDFYMGIGMRYKNSTVVRCRVVEGVGDIPIQASESSLAPNIALGFKLGFGL